MFDTSAGPNVIRADDLNQIWLNDIRQRYIPEIRGASNTQLFVSRTIALHLCTGESRTGVTFGVVDILAVPVSVWTIFIDKSIPSIHTVERKIIPHNTPPVPVLMLHEPKSEVEKNKLHIHQCIGQAPALLATPSSGQPKSFTVAR